jgi:hypothetical protein
MAGVTADEGAKLIADLIYLGSSVDAGTTLQLGLFTNNLSQAAMKALALTAVTEPTGGGYARKTLTRASFTRAGGVSGYEAQIFTPVTVGYTGTIYGYFIATTGTTPRLLEVELYATPITLPTVNTTHSVALNSTTS